MSVLDSIMARRRRECAERRSYLAGLEGLGERLRGDAQRLRDEIECNGDGDGMAERQAALEHSVVAIDDQIAAARGALAAMERALQRLERSQARVNGREPRGSNAV